jgi:phosphoribosylglycinamide formyltransferase 1
LSVEVGPSGFDCSRDDQPPASLPAGHPALFRLAVLASGNGSNLQAIIDALHRHRASGPVSSSPSPPLIEVALVVSDVPGARALKRAESAGIPTVVLPFESYPNREAHDQAMVAAIQEAQVDLVVLAGYMRLVSPRFIQAFPWRIINVHPSLLPAFPGTSSVVDAVRYGVRVTGVTVHFVDEGLDTGPIISQETVRIPEDTTPERLAECIHAVEHRLLPGVIRQIAEGRVRTPLPGSRVVRVDWPTGTEPGRAG